MTETGLDRLKLKIDRRWEVIRGLTLEGVELHTRAPTGVEFKCLRARILSLQDEVKKMESRYNLKSKEPYTQHQDRED